MSEPTDTFGPPGRSANTPGSSSQVIAPKRRFQLLPLGHHSHEVTPAMLLRQDHLPVPPTRSGVQGNATRDVGCAAATVGPEAQDRRGCRAGTARRASQIPATSRPPASTRPGNAEAIASGQLAAPSPRQRW